MGEGNIPRGTSDDRKIVPQNVSHKWDWKGELAMNWKKEAEQKLRNYGVRRHALVALPQQIAQVRSRRRDVRSSRTDGAAVAGGGSRREEYLVDSITYQEQLEQQLRETREYVSGMEEALSALTREEQLILDRFYINPLSGGADRLCEELNLERSTVYRRKERALRRFTMALFGWEEVKNGTN